MINRLTMFCGSLGRKTRSSFAETARLAALVQESAYWTFVAPLAGHKGLRREAFSRQLVFMGTESVFIIALVGASVGAGLDIPSGLYLQASFNALVAKDVLTGLAKSVVFAFLVGLIATYQGLSVKGGAEGVGKATTQSVVYSVIAIIIADCVCTTLFFYVLS